MSGAALQFKDGDRVGRVAAVDTSKILIEVHEPTLMTRIGVGHLVAVKGATEREYLIGITERVTRTTREEMLGEEGDTGDSLSLEARPEDVIRAVLVGTYRTIHGEEKNKFKRGSDSFPQIDRDCYVIEGPNLQRFRGCWVRRSARRKGYCLAIS